MSSPEIVPVALVTEDEARLHLRLDVDAESPPGPVDRLLSMKILQASDIVVDYLKLLDHEWTTDTCPPTVKAAVLLVLTMLYDHVEDDPLTPGVKNLLQRYRDPALA